MKAVLRLISILLILLMLSGAVICVASAEEDSLSVDLIATEQETSKEAAEEVLCAEYPGDGAPEAPETAYAEETEFSIESAPVSEQVFEGEFTAPEAACEAVADSEVREEPDVAADTTSFFAAPSQTSLYVKSPGYIKSEYIIVDKWYDVDPSKTVDHIEGVRITTSTPDYYIRYRAKTAANGWGSWVYSTRNWTYAGAWLKPTTNIEIQVYNNLIGEYDNREFVVMYRAKVAGEWLDWVSNGTEDVMLQIKEEFSLTGGIDAASTDSGWASRGNITSLEILVFERRSVEGTVIDTPYINQYANGIPNGCECASAVMAMEQQGAAIDVLTFVNNFLPMGSAPSNGIGSDPGKVYVGDPRLTGGLGWGCYPPVIVKAANSALDETKWEVKNETGSTLPALCTKYVDRGIPVVVWATTGMTSNVSKTNWVTPEGKKIEYNNRLHSLVLAGYDSTYYYFYDPQVRCSSYEYVAYPRGMTENAYDLLGKKAVAVWKVELTVDTLPDKTEYLTGEPFTSEGLSVSATYADGSTVSADNCSVSSVNTSSAGTKTVSVSWTDELGGEFSTSFVVTVVDGRVPGDANGDRRVDMRDVLIMRKHILNVQKVSEEFFANADMDENGYINMRDVLAVRKKILNIV